MRRFFPLAVLIVLVAGCKPKDETVDTPPASTTAASGGVTPMVGGAAGGLSPVSGSESVEGAGSGVGQSALGAAHRAAAKEGSSPSVGGDASGGGE